jgi:hypothetical protein
VIGAHVQRPHNAGSRREAPLFNSLIEAFTNP